MSLRLLQICCIVLCFNVFSANAAPPDRAGPPASDVVIVEQPVDVNVTNDSNVTIGNDASSPVPIIDTFTRVPFAATLNLNLPSGAPNNNPGTAIYTVPAGMHAVIENISVVNFILEGQWSAVGVQTSLDSQVTEHIIGPPFVSTPLSLTEPSQHFQYSRSLRLYADQQTDIVLRFIRNGLSFSGLSQFSVAISGYLVSINSPSLSP